MQKPISSHAQTIKILREHQLSAKKKFGQNFIIDPKIVEKIARLSDAQDRNIIEIGPGIGALTEQLLMIAKYVTAYEIDKDCIKVLDEQFHDKDNLTVIDKDFLTTTSEEIEATQASHCVGNLPYYITTPILFHILEDLPSIRTITIMVQREVADRFNAQVNTKDYNALSIILQTLCDIKMVMKVPPNVFHPAPNVDSAVVQLIRKDVDQASLKPFFALVKKGFVQRRKTLTNNLKDVPNIKAILNELNLSESIRAEALTLDQWRQIYEMSSLR